MCKPLVAKLIMKYIRIIFISFVLLSVNPCYSQTKDTIREKDDFVLIDPLEDWPVFKGGEDALHCFIFHNLDTIKLKKIRKVGLIAAYFVVDTTGILKDIKIVRGLDSIADNEFLRVIKLMPAWEPAKQYSKKVTCPFYLPLRLPYKNKFCPL